MIIATKAEEPFPEDWNSPSQIEIQSPYGVMDLKAEYRVAGLILEAQDVLLNLCLDESTPSDVHRVPISLHWKGVQWISALLTDLKMAEGGLGFMGLSCKKLANSNLQFWLDVDFGTVEFECRELDIDFPTLTQSSGDTRIG